MTTIHTIEDANHYAPYIGRLIDNRDGHFTQLGATYPHEFIRVGGGEQPIRLLAVYATLAQALADYQRYAERNDYGRKR